MFNPELADATRTARERTGMTQEDVAKRTGLGRSHINSIERGGVKKPDSDSLKKLAAVYGVHPSVFLRYAGYVVDESTLPTRKESDVILELYVRALARERESETNSPPARVREMVGAFR